MVRPAVRQLHRLVVCGFIRTAETYLLDDGSHICSVRSPVDAPLQPVRLLAVIARLLVELLQSPTIHTIHSTALLAGELSL